MLASELSRAAASPTILSQPEKAVVTAGSNHTFSVTASGAGPLQYQWFRNEISVDGATTQDLFLPNVQTNHSGAYQVVVSDVNGSTTSVVARLVVRLPEDPVYATPEGGWTYIYAGSGISNAGPNALDGTWNHDNGSDSWSGDARGAGAGLLGGVSTTNGILTIEDAVVSGSSSVDNRRYYFTHNLLQDLPVPAADSILSNGVTLSFRARLAPPPPADPLMEITNAPNGFVNGLDGKGMIGIRQAGENGMLISFTLNQAIEDISTSTTFNFGEAGLHMNNLNGDVRSAQVDPGDGGLVNVLPLDPTAFHEFWITMSDNGVDPGTHRVAIYIDGNTTPVAFNVTAGSGLDAPFTNYIAIGLPSTGQRGAFDLDFFAYAPGVIVPAGLADPVQIVTLPASRIVSEGQTATLSVDVLGTPPFTYQWYRNGILLSAETNRTYITPPATADDDGAQFVVTVSNICGVVTSAPPAVLTFLLPPTIVSEPADVVVTNGAAASFSLVATSSVPITYQWRHNGTPLPDETNSVFAINNAGLLHAGGYDAIASNPAGSTTSRVAVLTIRVLDFGDAPAPYATVTGNDGATHLLGSGIYLGTAVDFELDGIPEFNAEGDDLSGSDDEDGVTFASPLRAGQLCAVELVAATQGVLNAWIDFDRNGNWSGAGEQVFTNIVLAAGTNQLVFTAPGTASGGETFARFRFGTTAGLGPDGPAPDGEVEDYRVIVAPVAELAVTMAAGPDPVAVGSNLVYAITVTNSGPSPATGVTLASTLPPGVSFVTATPSAGACVEIAGALNCNFGNVPPGGVVTLSVTVVPNVSGMLTNIASVSADEFEINLLNNTVSTATTIELAPFIESPPVSLVVTQGNAAVFTIAAGGSAPLSYQWNFQGTNLPGQTTPTLTIIDAQATHAGTYTAMVSNRVGTTQSDSVTLTVLIPPTITEQPVSRTNAAGTTAILSVIATGTLPLSYQWYFEDSALASATSATMVLANVQTNNTGNYWVVAANSVGSVTSAVAHLTVIELDFGDAPDPYPTLLASNGARHLAGHGVFLGTVFDIEPDGQPSSGATGDDITGAADEDGIIFRDAFLAGQIANIDVVASTNGFLNGWFDFDGNGTWSDGGDQILTNVVLLAGTNSLSFEIPPSAPSVATFARFRFSAAEDLGFAGEAPDGEVEDYAVRVGSAVQLSIAISASPPITAVGGNVLYEITVTNHGPSAASSVTVTDRLPEALSFVSAVPSVGSCTNENGLITCDLASLSSSGSATVLIIVRAELEGSITNRCSISSVDHELFAGDNTAAVIAEAHLYPAIVQHPISQSVAKGGSVTINVIATGTALQYQWSFNGTNIAGSTNSSLVLLNAQPANEGLYVVAVSNLVGSVTSAPAQLTVLLPPQITTHPQSASVLAGASVTFSVGVQGTSPFAYQWFRGGVAVSGQTGATLFIASAQSSDEGVYTVEITNGAGAVQSEPATLIVLVAPQIATPPQSSTNFAGGTATFSVFVTGTGPLSYQWFFNGTNLLVGASTPVLMLPNIQDADAGAYHVVVTNIVGGATSLPATLSIAHVDFGDAPDIGYPTLLSFNGAHHFIAPGVHLGAGVDSEPDGLPTGGASGDDLAGIADEDGIIFSEWFVGQTSAVQVVVSTNGFLAAWVDFNRNGTWSELGEQVLASIPVTAGTNSVWFPVPATAIDGQTYARFRFSTTPGLLLDGPAADGEIEDYEVTIERAIDLSLEVTDEPDPVLANTMLTSTLIVSNRGPSEASAVTLTNTLPTNATFVSAVSSQGACTNIAGEVICDLGILGAGQSANVVMTLVPLQPGTITNRYSVSAAEIDVNSLNNAVVETTAVVAPTAVYGSAVPVSILDGTMADVYPSTIFVSGVTATVAKVIVTLSNLTHAMPSDLDVLLVSPGGQRVLLMSDAGTRPGITDVTVTFDDASVLSLPETGRFVTETYRPTNFGSGDAFPGPAPPGPYANQLSAFDGIDPNGTWSLYIVDDSLEESGFLAGGWGITFLTLEQFADVRLTQRTEPSPVAIGSNVIFHVTATNQGPADATGVRITSILPSSVTLVSFSSTQGQCTADGLVIECVFGDLANGQSATLSVVATPTVSGVITNEAIAAANELDFAQENNHSRGEVVVKLVNDLVLLGAATPEPVLLGQQLTYSLTVSNMGPNAATDVRLRHELPPAIVFVGADSSQGACTNNGSLVSCDLGTVNPGQTVIITVLADPVAVGDVIARSVVSAYEIDLGLPDNERLFSTTIGDVPTFTLTPQSQTVPVLSNATFTIAATGPAPIAYQWLFNGVPISGEASSVFSIPSVRPFHAGTYSVIASNRFGAVTSSAAQLQVDYTGYRNATVSLVSRTDSWRYNHDAVDLGSAWREPGFDDASWSAGLALFGEESSEPYPYPVAIATPLPLATVAEEPIITYYFRTRFDFQNPGLVLGLVSSNLVDDGALFYLNGTPLGSLRMPPQPISYSSLSTGVLNEGVYDVLEWPVGALLPGTNVLAIEVHQVNPGSSDIVFGSTLSARTVPISDLIVSQSSTPSAVGPGSNLVLVTVVSNAGPASASDIQVQQSWTSPAIFAAATSTHGLCSFDGTNVTCSISSLAVGEVATVAVTVVPQTSGPFVGTVFARGAELDLELANNSAESEVIVREPPAILAGPLSQTVTNGDSVGFNATVAGAEPLSVQWLHNGVEIPDATNTFFNINQAQIGDAGNYQLRASNDVGLVQSEAALLRVLVPPTISSIGDQVGNEDTPIGPLLFTISDLETPSPNLQLTAESSNPLLVPNANIQVGGTDANRTITILPATNQTGAATIGLTVRDGDGLVTTETFDLVVNPVNDLPGIIGVGQGSVPEDMVFSTTLTVADPETPASALLVTAVSSNPSLIPDSNVLVTAGTDGTRNVEITPAPNQFGSSVIVLTVRDEQGGATTASLVLTVDPVNDAPIISDIPNQNTSEDTPLPLIVFTVSDLETIASNLTVTAVSSDPTLLPPSSFNLDVSGANRSLVITPAPGQFGLAAVVVTVSDGQTTAVEPFLVSVSPVNDAPVISVIPDQAISVNSSTPTVAFMVADIDDPVSNLVVTAQSSNPSLVNEAGIAFSSGSESDRTFTVTPSPDQFGLTVITLTVTDVAGASGMSVFEVLVNQTNGPPAIAVHPQDQTLTRGSDLILRVVATGPGPLMYQWRRYGIDLSGETNSTLVRIGAQPANSGDYTVLVSNAQGSVLSNPARVCIDGCLVLAITRVGSSVTISFATVVGLSYTVEFTDVIGGVWTPLGSAVEGSGNPVSVSDGISGSSTRVYRLRAE